MALMSCGGQKSRRVIDSNKIDALVEEISFPPQEVLQLKSYYLSSPVHSDSINILVGYNYRLHALDYIDLNSKLVTQTTLSTDGPNAIMRLSSIYAHTIDSVWVSDDSERVFLIDHVGNVKKIVDLKAYLKDSEQVLLNTNYALYTSHLYYNNTRGSLMFLVENVSSSTFGVKEVFLDKEVEPITYELSSSKVILDMSSGYAYMDCPNVNFSDDNIIYNYPVESSIYVLNISTNERKYFLSESRYTSNIVQKCSSKGDYQVLEKHRLESPYFYDVMYIPKYKMYARLHIDKIEYDANKRVDELINERDLYLMLFNDKFEKICERRLPRRRYNYFTGWSTTYGGVILFVDNILDPQNDTDDLTIDLISPK